MALVVRFAVILIVSSVAWAACTEGPKTASVLILAAEALPFEAIPCSEMAPDAKDLRGFELMCQESVRFTHAYSPSPMSPVGLASLLTGLWPYEHGVRDPGPKGLNSEVTTLAELAREKGFHTAFFSGGAPVWRQSGLSQGFELFEDNIQISKDRLFRPASETLDLFRLWMKRDVGSQPFFSILHFADLQDFDVRAEESGVPVDRSYAGRLLRLDDSLREVLDWIRSEGRWESTHIVLLGLNGDVSARTGEFRSVSLYSENTQVVLMVKPARKKRDLGMAWKVDPLVSFPDLARTLGDLMGLPELKPSSPQSYSLRGALEGETKVPPSERWIPIESGWTMWAGLGGVRNGLRQGPYFFLNDEPGRTFNTLSDRTEISPQVGSALGVPMTEIPTDYRPFPATPLGLYSRRVILAQEMWQKELSIGIEIELPELHLRKFPKDRVVAGWLASRYLAKNDWGALEKLGQQMGEEFWQSSSSLALGKKIKGARSACLRLLEQGPQAPDRIFRACNDHELVRTVREGRLGDEAEAERLRDRIQLLNYKSGLTWDIRADSDTGPSLSELYQALVRHLKTQKTNPSRH